MNVVHKLLVVPTSIHMPISLSVPSSKSGVSKVRLLTRLTNLELKQTQDDAN